ncbi:MAG TPA: pyridoxamine 5'-phosphate oxidase family protein [Desulfotignum sp.]|jgi:uncharacterized protein|nr:pyridoxamine 5'-phosphate oxidase family protein [Desulfotignum sp.]
MSSNPPVKRFPELISQARVMTLATGGDDGPWTAPVYYLYRDRGFYFFSSPDSRHILDGRDRRCAASIFAVHADVKKLEGLQMSGTVHQQKTGLRAAAVATAYAKRFGIAVSGSDPLGFFQTAFHARLYVFLPDLIYHMDNQQGFGCREVIAL